jgi:hypothetical protein
VLLLVVLLLLLRIWPAAAGGHCHRWCILYVLHYVQQVLVHFLLVPVQQCRGNTQHAFKRCFSHPTEQLNNRACFICADLRAKKTA